MFGPINVHREGMTTVYRTSGLMQAEIVKGRLESAGIPVMLDYESVGRVMGITIDGLGEVRILVPNERADEAKELLTPRPDDEQVTGEE